MNHTETDDAWRVYRREWVIVHTVSGTGEIAEPFTVTAHAWAKDNLTGRIRDDDIRLQANTDHHGAFWVHVQVYKDNLKGEFKNIQHAQTFALGEGYDEYVIVPRNSKSDHDIRNYGVKML